MTDTPFRVLLVDDQRIWYVRVAELLPELMVDWAKTVGDCQKELERHHHHVVIMDLDLESRCDPSPGLELTDDLTSEYFSNRKRYTALVTLTHYDQYAADSLVSGSIDVVRKPRTCEEFRQFNTEFAEKIRALVDMVERFRQLESVMSRPMSGELEKGNIRLEVEHDSDFLDESKYWAHLPNKSERLRRKEFKILRIFLENSGPVPPEVLMRQAGIKTRGALNATLSGIRGKIGRSSIPSSKRGYYLEI